ncbi:class I SAM-dependent methyltransferase [Burkholderiales bacterium]|nr:class I SAM-dependent methyltransferase [Burkholderiales bacterium]
MSKQQSIVSRQQFRQIYMRSVEDVMRFWTPHMQEEISRHNAGWRTGSTDFEGYLKHSELRCWTAFDMLASRNEEIDSWCDIGGFFGAYCLTLRRLGIAVAMTESLKYYSNSFSPLFAYLRQEGVEVIDHDPFGEGVWAGTASYSVVSAMAVFEHYPHSQKYILEFMSSIVAPRGSLYIEVPNIAYWPRRWAMLNGRSPLPSALLVYESGVPFTGHHREYTMLDLNEITALAGLRIDEARSFNYSFVGSWIMRLISDPILTLMSLHPSMRECLVVILSRCADYKKQDK